MDVPEGSAAIERTLSLIHRALPPPGGGRVVIAIDGLGGAGKSTLAARVAARLDRAMVIHTDDFASWDNPLDWWPRLVDQVLRPLSEGRTARFQRFDWDAQRLAEWHEIGDAGYVIIEGVSASRREFRPYLAASVWVTTNRQERLQRGLERDGQGAVELWRRWQLEEDAYVVRDRPEEAVDLIISGEQGDPWPGPGRPDKEPEALQDRLGSAPPGDDT